MDYSWRIDRSSGIIKQHTWDIMEYLWKFNGELMDTSLTIQQKPLTIQ
jgi:hypothetical protein